MSMAVPLRVLIRVKPSAPAFSTAKATLTMSAVFGVSLTSIGREVASLTTAVTLEAWIRLRSYEQYQNIVSKFSEWPFNGYVLQAGQGPSPSDGIVIWHVADNGTLGSTFSTTDLSLDTWYHVVGTFGAGTARIYINGVEEDSNTGSLESTSSNLNVGRWPGLGGQSYFDGSIDRVRVYNRALSPEEVFYSYLVSYSHYHGAPSP